MTMVSLRCQYLLSYSHVPGWPTYYFGMDPLSFS
jgi:hypothetical protein